MEFDITLMENDNVEAIKKLDLKKINIPLYTLCAKYDSVKILEHIHKKNPNMKNNYFANSDAMYIAINHGSTKVFSYIIDNGFYFSYQIKDIILDRHTKFPIQVIGKNKIMQIIENSVLIIGVDNVVNYKGEQISTYIKPEKIFEDEIHEDININVKIPQSISKPKYRLGINATPIRQTSLKESLSYILD
ncbi:DNA/RNA helicase [Acanthamoeba polyphaga moumouvirus]|uniref:DNA/RNA helicase n=1 Tax=Acanthamoeba polyphaga moumouvirus TaxID=1269028 RepID=L7RBU3_9VIRU|nr:DNA/RNA helicase [Acanthamoeba polyphaga moumouvirus]AGC01677.1 DNA/RNA helicase [Acanthamoeba polyphaga moumouvirus]AQN68015.1 DNA/RNA helicase [Saudi moumouvirus]